MDLDNEKFAVISKNFYNRVMPLKDTDGMAISFDPDQSSTLEAV